MADFKKTVEIEINVTGSLGEVFNNFSKSFESSNLNLGNVRGIMEGIEEAVKDSAGYAKKLGQALEAIKMPKGFSDTMKEFRKLSQVRLPNLDGFTTGLSALSTISIPDSKHVNDIATALKGLTDLGPIPSLEGFAKGVAVFNEVETETITKAASAFDKLYSSILPYKSLSVPNLEQFSKGILLLADNTVNAKVTKLPLKFRTIANSLKQFEDIKGPPASLKQFAEGIRILTETSVNAKVTQLPLKFTTLAESISKLKETKVPQLGQFASGVQKLAEIDEDQIIQVGISLETLHDKLVKFKELKVPQLSQFAKGLQAISALRSDRIDTIAQKLNALHAAVKKYDGIKTPQLGQFAKGVGQLAEIPDVTNIVSSLEKLEPVLDSFHDVKAPDLSGFAKGVSVLSNVKVDDDFGTNLDKIGKAIEKFPKSSGSFPDLKGFAAGIKVLNSVKVGNKLSEKIETIGTALETFPKDITAPNLKNFADGIKSLNKIELDADFGDKLTKIATGINQFKVGKTPNLKNFADGLKDLNTIELREDFVRVLRKLAIGIQQFTKIKVPNLKNFAEGLDVINQMTLKTVTVENIENLGIAFQNFKNIKVPNLKGFAEGMGDLKQIDAIDQDFSKKLKDIAQALDVFSKVKVPSLSGIAKGITDISKIEIPDKFAANLEKLREALSGFNKDIKVPALKPFAEGIKELANVGDFNTALPEFFRKLAGALTAFDKIGVIPNLDSMAKGLIKLEKLDINAITKKLVELSKSIKVLEKSGQLKHFASFAADLNNLSTKVSGVNVKLGNTRSRLSKLGYAAASASAGMSKFNGSLYGISRGLSAINAGLTTITGFTASFAAVFAVKGAVRELATFDDALRAAGATAQASTNELKEFEVVIRALGATTRYTSSQVAEAARQLSMAGFAVQETITALPQVLNLATSGMMDIGRAADITTNILRGYHMEVKELQRINDVLVAGFTNSSTNLEQLGTAFQYVGPLASAANIEFEETGALLAGLAQAGYHSSKAGMSLRNAITRLLDPTRKVRESLDNLGISVMDSNGEMLSMIDILSQFKRAGADVSDIITIFGKRAGPGMAALINQGEESLNKFLVTMRTSAGISNQVARDMEAGMGGALRQIKSAWQEMAIEFGREIEPAVLNMIRELTRIIRENKAELSNLGAELLSAAIAIGKVAAAVGTLIVQNATLIKSLVALSIAGVAFYKIALLSSKIYEAGTAATFLSKSFIGLTASTTAARIGIIQMGVVIKGFLASMALMTGLNPIFLGIAAAVATAGAALLAYNKIFGKTTDDFIAAGDKINVTNTALIKQNEELKELVKTIKSPHSSMEEIKEAEIRLAEVVPLATSVLDEQGNVLAKLGAGFEKNEKIVAKVIEQQEQLIADNRVTALKLFAAGMDKSSSSVEKLEKKLTKLNKIRATAGEFGQLGRGYNSDAFIKKINDTAKALNEEKKSLGVLREQMKQFAQVTVNSGSTLEDFKKELSGIRDLTPDMFSFLVAQFKKFEAELADVAIKTRNAMVGVIETWKKEFDPDNVEFSSPFAKFYDTAELEKMQSSAIGQMSNFSAAISGVNTDLLQEIDERKRALIDEKDVIEAVYKHELDAIQELQDKGKLSEEEAFAQRAMAHAEYSEIAIELAKKANNVEKDALNEIDDLVERSVTRRGIVKVKSISRLIALHEKEKQAIDKKYIDENNHIADQMGYLDALFGLREKYNRQLANIGSTGASGGDAAKIISEDTQRIEELEVKYESHYLALKGMRDQDVLSEEEYKADLAAAEAEFAEEAYRLRAATYQAFVEMHGKDSAAAKMSYAEMTKAHNDYLDAKKESDDAIEGNAEAKIKDETKAVKKAYKESVTAIKSGLALETAELEKAAAANVELEEVTNELIAEKKLEAQQAMLLATQKYADDMGDIVGVDPEKIEEAEKKALDARIATIDAQTAELERQHAKEEAARQKQSTKITASYTKTTEEIARQLDYQHAVIDAAVQKELMTVEQGEAEKQRLLLQSHDDRIKAAQAKIDEIIKMEASPERKQKLEAAEAELSAIMVEKGKELTAKMQQEHAKRLSDIKSMHDKANSIIKQAYADRNQAIALKEAQDSTYFIQAQKDKLASVQQFYQESLIVAETTKAKLEENPLINSDAIIEITKEIEQIHQAHYDGLVDMAIEAYQNIAKEKEDIKKLEKSKRDEVKAHEDALEDIKDLEKDAQDDITKIWESYAKDKEEVEKALSKFLADQADERYNAEKTLRDKINDLDDDLDEKIRKRKQAGMSDNQKRKDDDKAYYKAKREAEELIAKGIEENDKGAIERGKKKAEQMESLAEGRKKEKAAIRGMKEATALQVKAEEGLKGVADYEAEQKAIEKKKASEEKIAADKKKAEEAEKKRAQELIDAREEMRTSIQEEEGMHGTLYATIEEAENARHTLEMANIAKEITAHQKKLNLYESQVGKPTSGESSEAKGTVTSSNGISATYDASASIDDATDSLNKMGAAGEKAGGSITSAMDKVKNRVGGVTQETNEAKDGVGDYGQAFDEARMQTVSLTENVEEVGKATKSTVKKVLDEFGKVKEVIATGDGYTIKLVPPSATEVSAQMKDALPAEGVPVEANLKFKKEAVTEYKGLMTELVGAKRELSETPLASPKEVERVGELKTKYGEMRKEYETFVAAAKASDGGISTKEAAAITEMQTKMKSYFGYVQQETEKLRAQGGVLTFSPEDGQKLDEIRGKFANMFEGMEASSPAQELKDIVTTLNAIGDDGSRSFGKMIQKAVDLSTTVDGLELNLTMDANQPLELIETVEGAADGLSTKVESIPFEFFSDIPQASEKIINHLGEIEGAVDLAAEKKELEFDATQATQSLEGLKTTAEEVKESAGGISEELGGISEDVPEVEVPINTEGIDEAEQKIVGLSETEFTITGTLMLAASAALPATEKIAEIKTELGSLSDEAPVITVTMEKEEFNTFIEDIDGLESVTVDVKINLEGKEELGSVNDWITKLREQEGVEVLVEAEVEGQKDLDDAKTTIDEIIGKLVEVIISVTGTSLVKAAKAAIDNIPDETHKYIYVHTVQVSGKEGGGLVDAVSHFANGGDVFRKLTSPFISKGGGTKDDVPAMLMKGEFVLKKSAVEKYGKKFLYMMNMGMLNFDNAISKYANGGMVNNVSNMMTFPSHFETGGFVDRAKTAAFMMGRQAQLAMNPKAPFKSDDVVYNISAPSFHQHVGSKVGKIKSGAGKARALSLVNLFSALAPKLQDGGNVSELMSQWTEEKSIINQQYDEDIRYAKETGDEEQAYLLELEQLQLEELANSLAVTLNEIRFEYEQELLEATTDLEEQVDEFEEEKEEAASDYREAMADLNDERADIEREYLKEKRELERDLSKAEIELEIAERAFDNGAYAQVGGADYFNRKGSRFTYNTVKTDSYGDLANNVTAAEGEVSYYEQALRDSESDYNVEQDHLDEDEKNLEFEAERAADKAESGVESANRRFTTATTGLESQAQNEETGEVAKARIESSMIQLEAQHNIAKSKSETSHNVSALELDLQLELLHLRQTYTDLINEEKRRLEEEARAEAERAAAASSSSSSSTSTTQQNIGIKYWLNSGGYVGFPRGKKKWEDSVEAMLTPGEYVVKQDAVDHYGVDFMEALNNREVDPEYSAFPSFLAKPTMVNQPTTIDGVTYHVNTPSFHKNLAGRTHKITTPEGQAAAKKMITIFSDAVPHLAIGGDIGSSEEQLAFEIGNVTDEYEEKIRYAREIGADELAYILENEKIELEMVAEELRFTLEELQMEREFALMEAQFEYEAEMMENEYEMEEALFDIEMDRLDAKMELEQTLLEAEEARLNAQEDLRQAREATRQYNADKRKYDAAVRAYDSANRAASMATATSSSSLTTGQKIALSKLESLTLAATGTKLHTSAANTKTGAGAFTAATVAVGSSHGIGISDTTKAAHTTNILTLQEEYEAAAAEPASTSSSASAGVDPGDAPENPGKSATNAANNAISMAAKQAAYARSRYNSLITMYATQEANARSMRAKKDVMTTLSYTNAVAIAEREFASGTTKATNAATLEAEQIRNDSAHDYKQREEEMIHDIKIFEVELAKALFDLKKQYSTADGDVSVKHFLHTGGPVGYPVGAMRGRDSINAMLTPGEYVVNESAVRKFGVEFFEKLNKMKMPKLHFAEGGLVPGNMQSTAGTVDTGTNTLLGTINLQVGGNTYPGQFDLNVAKNLVKEFKKMGMSIA